MRIGIDFDNTLACYDRGFTNLARDWEITGVDERQTKQGIRQIVRRKINGELLWQRLQGTVYGLRMSSAEQFSGEDHFLRRCTATPGLQVFIVSHKTEFGHFDETRTNLRDAARQWMRDKGFFDPAIYAIPESHLFFKATQEEKVACIASLQCDIFIDDLADLFLNPSFPPGTKRILFTNGEPHESLAQVDHICACWSEIERLVFGS
ncbi:MAG: hypothetical protein WC091_03800 [Sulfuricellaceae bacterium]